MKLLVFAHVPPPHHGQSYMVKLMLDGLGGDRARANDTSRPEQAIECYHVNAQFSTDMEDVGGFRLGKLLLAFRYSFRALWLRFRHGVKTFYYVPAPARNTPLFRDWLVLLICRPFFPRLILHWHAVGLGQWNERRGAPMFRWITRKILGHADLSIVLSDFNRQDAERFLPQRVAVVGNGIPDPCLDYETAVRPLQEKRRIQRNVLAGATNAEPMAIQVLFLAHCISEKGLFDTLTAVALANEELQRKKSPLFFELAVAGEFFRAEERRQFDEMVSRPEWKGRCRYLGFVSAEQKEKAFREADLFCFPTYYRNEGQPVNLIEALAHGLPIITTRWRAIPGLLPEGFPLVEPQKPEQVAQLLLELAQRSDGARLREHYLREFTVERHLARLSEAILSVERPVRPAAGIKIALSILCENPFRKTGLTTLFHEFIRRALKLYPEISWLVFAGPEQEWLIDDPRVVVCRQFPSNERLTARLIADHLRVPGAARASGADLLVTTGFVPLRKSLPTALQVFSLQHLDRENRIGPVRRLYRWAVMRFSWSKADLVITNSQFAAHQITTACPGLSAHLLQSYEGLQHEQFHPGAAPEEASRLKARFGIQPGYFLWVSNFYPYKQAELLLEGYARLPQALRASHPLVMVGGSWGHSLRDCKELARQLGIAETVRFCGWIEDEWLAPLYRHARAFCLASREETFGRCVIEAMACGAPCVVNDIPVLREISGRAALLIDYRDSQAVEAALRQLASSKETFQRLREEGMHHARQFNFERLTTERITAIQQMLARQP